MRRDFLEKFLENLIYRELRCVRDRALAVLQGRGRIINYQNIFQIFLLENEFHNSRADVKEDDCCRNFGNKCLHFVCK